MKAYDLLSYRHPTVPMLAQPVLRAEMEADMNEIVAGRKEKDVVLQTAVEKYRDIFAQLARNTDVFSEAMRDVVMQEDHAPAGSVANPQFVQCACGHPPAKAGG